ncbi:MAG TPA: TonB family protein [Candidatus Obscuribacterales bacterium]
MGRALDIMRQHPEVNPQWIGSCLYDLAYLQFDGGDYGGAESTLKEAISLYEKAGARIELAKSIYLLALSQYAQSKLSEADQSFSRAIESYEQVPQLSRCHELAEMLRHRALYALWQEKFDEAQSLLNRTATAAISVYSPRVREVLEEAYYYLACLQLKQKSYSPALSLMQRALAVYQQPIEFLAESSPGEEQATEPTGIRPSQPDTVEMKPVQSATYGVISKAKRARKRKDGQKWSATPAPFALDSTVEPIPADEPVPPGGFPPLPNRLDLPVRNLSQGWMGRQAEPSAPESAADKSKGDAFSPAVRVLPMLQIPFFGILAQFGGDAFSAGDSFSAGSVPPPVDVSHIELSASDRISPGEIMEELFKRTSCDPIPPPVVVAPACARWPGRENAMRLAAMLMGKVKGPESAMAMDIMANAISGERCYTPQDVQAVARQRAEDRYIEELRDRIGGLWLPPPSKESRQIWASLALDKEGRLKEVSLIKPSGDAGADQSVVKAICRAAPFPPLTPGSVTNRPVQLVFVYHVLALPGEIVPPIVRVYAKPPADTFLDQELYVAALERKIQRLWQLPKGSTGKPARAHLTVSAAGQLSHLCLFEPSEDTLVDQSILRAAAEAGPYWPLPRTIGKHLDLWLDFVGKASVGKGVVGEITSVSRARRTVESDYTAYMAHLQQRIALSFFPPQAQASEPGTAKFRVRSDGSVSDLKLEKSSGLASRDTECLAAIERASPFYHAPVGAPEKIDIEFSFACGKGSSWALTSKDDGKPGSKGKAGSATALVGSLDLNSRPVSHASGPRSSRAHDGGSEGDVDFGPYMADLQRRIKRAWLPPSGTESKRAVVIFKVHKDGNVSHMTLEKSSGVASFDQAALKAIENAAPVLELPDGAPEDVDIQFTFDYNTGGSGGRGGFRQF